MTESNREQAIEKAAEKGREDGESCHKDKLNNPVHGLSELLHSSYQPPSDPDENEAYTEAFRRANEGE